MRDEVRELLKREGSNFRTCYTAEAAIERIAFLYEEGAERLRKAVARKQACKAYYPYLALYLAPGSIPLDAKPDFDVLLEPGLYGTSLTRPKLFSTYWQTQIARLIECYRQPVYVGASHRPMPLPYIVEEAVTDLGEEDLRRIQDRYALPNLHVTNDAIANSERPVDASDARPLALFTADRTDYSLARLNHYTGTSPQHFQRFILLTNYQRYVNNFQQHALEQLAAGNEYQSFISPGDQVVRKGDTIEPSGDALPQMPAYHLTREDGDGITLINIGVGPANAKTITDHLAVLRPHCWLMVGHCAGLRRTQQLGDYVLAHGYVRDDHVLDNDLPSWVPVPPIAEVQVALQEATQHITGLSEREIKTRLRTGTVLTTDNRNWELRLNSLFNQINVSRAIAVDMESATIAANGFRFRVPYGTLLCVSDKPLHGELKLKGMANSFYRTRVAQHLLIGIEAMRLLRMRAVDSLHSRKLRGFDEPPFR